MLTGRLTRVLPSTLIAIRYTAHSGAIVVLPVQAVRRDRHLAVLVGDADIKRWWRHFVGQAALEVYVDHHWTTGRAAVKVGPSTAAAHLYAAVHPDCPLGYSSVLVSIILDESPEVATPISGRRLGAR